jgi:hypothetical protein
MRLRFGVFLLPVGVVALFTGGRTAAAELLMRERQRHQTTPTGKRQQITNK